MTERECRFCGCTLFFSPASGWSGDHAPKCVVRRSAGRNAAPWQPSMPTPDNTFDPEQVIGPDGQDTWVVTYSLYRLAAADQGVDFTETRHVRAATMDGAILLMRELVTERLIDVEAWKITTKGEA